LRHKAETKLSNDHERGRPPSRLRVRRFLESGTAYPICLTRLQKISAHSGSTK